MSDEPLLRVALMVEDFPVISETFVINMAAGLLERGHDVTILAMSGQKARPASMHATVDRWDLGSRTRRPTAGRVLIGGFERDPEGDVPSRWGRPRRLAAFAAQAAMLVREQRFDVVHCQFAHLGLAAQQHRRLRTLRTDRLVVHVRGQDVTSFVRAHGDGVYRDLFATADLVVANSRHFRDRAIELGAPPSRMEVIGSAVDCSRFTPAGRSDADDSRPPSLVAVGRLVAKKGLDDAIRAVADVAADSTAALAGVHLDIIGDGPLRPELEALIDELHVADSVTLVGALPHEAIVDRFAGSHLLLAPSVTPASGDQDAPVNSLKEAMAMGLPVIGTRHGGIPELVEPGRNGYLVAENDPAALADTIRTAVAERTRWSEMGRAGRQRVVDEYDLPVVTEKLIRAYRSLEERPQR